MSRKDKRGNRSGPAITLARFEKALTRAGAAFLTLFALACGNEQDANNHDVFAIAHLAGTPNASLAVHEDRGYEFLDSGAKTKKNGTLSTSAFDSLAPHVSRDALQALYAHGEADSEVCARDPAGYVVNSNFGTACLVPQNVSEPQARGDLD